MLRQPVLPRRHPPPKPESSPFMGGPRRDPVVRDMYTTRSVRVDPTIAGSLAAGDGASKTNRLNVAEAAARLGLGRIRGPGGGMDVSLSSYAGSESPADDEWRAEFDRVLQALASPSGGARLFSAEFAGVPDVGRLAEWMATKWAPAVLRGYAIAGTRVGARPVYAARTGDGTVEIVWQELVDFDPVTSGRMVIDVGERGMTASRGAGDPSAGFGAVSATPLPGEDILVRKLADAASQATEKGLALKPKRKKKAKEVVATVAAVKPTVIDVADAAPAQPASSGPGPRGAGTRRSTERSRGSRRKNRQAAIAAASAAVKPTVAEAADAAPAQPASSGPGPRGASTRRSTERSRGSRRKNKKKQS